MGRFNTVVNVSARNANKSKLNPDGKAYVYMHGGVHSPDARSKKRYNVGGGNWIQKANLKKGAFTKQAKNADMSVQGFANKVTKSPGDYSPTTVRRARLAQTFKKMAKG